MTGETVRVELPHAAYIVHNAGPSDVRPTVVNAVAGPDDTTITTTPTPMTTTKTMTTDQNDAERSGTVFLNDEERAEAFDALAADLMDDERVEALEADPEAVREALAKDLGDRDHPAAMLFYAARDAGWHPEGCACEDVECEHTLAALGLTDADSAVENALSDAFPGDDDPAYYDGGVDLSDVPTGTRRSFEKRRAEEPEWQRRTVNMAGVAGPMRRNYGERDEETVEEYPGGTRRDWQRRRLGMDAEDSPDENEGWPTGTRESYEERRANASPDLPLTAKRQTQRREKRREAAAQHREAARRAGWRDRMPQFGSED